MRKTEQQQRLKKGEAMGDMRICPVCNVEVAREDMLFSHDCHGIPFRLICRECYNRIMEEKGYDGEYYTEADECIDYDY